MKARISRSEVGEKAKIFNHPIDMVNSLDIFKGWPAAERAAGVKRRIMIECQRADERKSGRQEVFPGANDMGGKEGLFATGTSGRAAEGREIQVRPTVKST